VALQAAAPQGEQGGRSVARQEPKVNLALQAQLANCNHRPFIHNILNDRYECLCGQTSIPIKDVCPSIACTCGRPKGEISDHR
jgi:hypothetical protein